MAALMVSVSRTAVLRADFDAAICSGENVDPSSAGKCFGDDDAEFSFGVMYLPGTLIHLFS
jgi:hypothetical protein